MFAKIIALAVLIAGSTAQVISADVTVSNINGITSMSASLNNTVSSITILNAVLVGPQIADGFQAIVNTGTQDYQEMTGSGTMIKYTVREQKMVCAALVKFVRVHQMLLASLDGKRTLLSAFAPQVASVLRSVEGVVDEIAFTLIGEVPSCAKRAKKGKKMLDRSLGHSISVYANPIPPVGTSVLPSIPLPTPTLRV